MKSISAFASLLVVVAMGCPESPEAVVDNRKPMTGEQQTVTGEQQTVTGEQDATGEEQAIAEINRVGGQWSTEPHTRQQLFEALIAHGRTRNAQEPAPPTSPEGKPLVSVNLIESKVTDTGLDYLKGLTSLQELLLDNTQITDTGLAEARRRTPDKRGIP